MTQELSPVAALFDEVSAVYETVGPPFFDRFGALLVQHAGVSPGERVLDLAAGSGAVSVPALSATGSSGSLLSVDAAPGMVARLAGLLAGSGHGDARATLGDASSPDVPDGSVDVVLCGFGLFFLPDPPAALRAWLRALRPGGRVALSTWAPMAEPFLALRDEAVALGAQLGPPREVYDDPDVLRSALLQAGLDDVAVTTVSADLVLPDVAALLAWAGSHGGRAWLKQLDPAQTSRLAERLRERWPGEVPMTWRAHLGRGAGPSPATTAS